MNVAATAAVEEKLLSSELGTPDIGPSRIKTSHFEPALRKISPSVSKQVLYCMF